MSFIGIDKILHRLVCLSKRVHDLFAFRLFDARWMYFRAGIQAERGLADCRNDGCYDPATCATGLRTSTGPNLGRFVGKGIIFPEDLAVFLLPDLKQASAFLKRVWRPARFRQSSSIVFWGYQPIPSPQERRRRCRYPASPFSELSKISTFSDWFLPSSTPMTCSIDFLPIPSNDMFRMYNANGTCSLCAGVRSFLRFEPCGSIEIPLD